MEEDFYATIKLTSGEEILGKVCYLPDEDKVLIDRPLLVEVAKTKKGNVEVSGFSLKEWINATFENMFIIDKSSVITMSELEDKIADFYITTCKRIDAGKNGGNGGYKLSRSSGYLGSIARTKNTLENIYKKS
tara:strand:+ start:220 stop:618 length:399 start_codon:yes stop_codon:yes gene_type:complete